MKPDTIKLSALLDSPANFLALGAGLGLAPKAPGTFGTLLGIPLLLVMPQSLAAYLAVLCVLSLVGVWSCHLCARSLGVHDHPGIVWDEVVGYLITMIAVPRSVWWVVIGFAMFRLFDILKPWPISWIDRQVHGGLGIMLDDMLAALFALAVMHLLLFLF
ncbi:phosphatidylglycerophosphatase A family protein [Granulosicoccus sp. 3-233]|uniref:phosphatidylglycerophosphatase A family protein n=1 Tax=Granulosicoccus sp. 3-233 TaxID=3417969 RepID=UPI003D32DCED